MVGGGGLAERGSGASTPTGARHAEVRVPPKRPDPSLLVHDVVLGEEASLCFRQPRNYKIQFPKTQIRVGHAPNTTREQDWRLFLNF